MPIRSERYDAWNELSYNCNINTDTRQVYIIGALAILSDLSTRRNLESQQLNNVSR